MQIKSMWDRRGFPGTALATVSSVFAPRCLFANAGSPGTARAVNGFGQSGNPYDELVAQQLSRILREHSA
jgi:hypothetical protein